MEIFSSLAITLGGILVWTSALSMSNRFLLKGNRNLASLLILIFISGLSSLSVNWLFFATAAAVMYTAWDLFQNTRPTSAEQKNKLDFRSFLNAKLAWPIMFTEAIEYLQAEDVDLKVSGPEPIQIAEKAAFANRLRLLYPSQRRERTLNLKRRGWQASDVISIN
jgi:hypothetical protein